LLALFFLSFVAASALAQDTTSTDTYSLPIKPVSLDGSITASLTKYSVEGAERRRPATSWTFVGTPTLSFYGVSIPTTFIFSDQENDFRQPFNQIGVSPTYKWATLHVGYRSLSYSRYTLAGATFLGAGLDLNPGPIRFSAMYGRFQRAVEEDTLDYRVQPAYERKGYAVKFGFGSEKNFVDLIYLHSKDDSSSLKRQPTIIPMFPTENAVVGLNTRISLLEELALEAEGAASFYTRDVRSPAASDDKVPHELNFIIPVKNSTNLTFANNIGLVLTVPHFSARLGYERIEPDFNSHGAYYFTTDVENYTLAPNFDIFNGKLRVGGSVGLQHDNLLHTKLSRTNRVIGSGNLSFNPAQVFGIDLNYTNYSTQQGTGVAPSTSDSVRVRNISQSGSITPRLLFITQDNSHSIVLSLSHQAFDDQNIYTSQFSDSKTTTGSLNYNLSFFSSGWNFGASFLYADTRQGDSIHTTLNGFNINTSKSFFENKMNLGANFGMTFNNTEPLGIKSTTYNENLNASYRISNQGTFTFTIYATQNASGISGVNSTPFKEITATLSYSHNFSF
jgi:hypothetical protein